MFEGAVSFNQPLGRWDVSRITQMRTMFHTARMFNQDLSSWDVSLVEDHTEMMSLAM